jgi:hypothetical protein
MLKTILMILALTGVASTGYVYYNATYSPDNWIFQGGSADNWTDGGAHGASAPTAGGVHGAPGPLAGAGLPVLVAYGAYRLVRRRRRKAADGGFGR